MRLSSGPFGSLAGLTASLLALAAPAVGGTACSEAPIGPRADGDDPGSGGSGGETAMNETGGEGGGETGMPDPHAACPDFALENEARQLLIFCDDFLNDEIDRRVWSFEEGMIRNEEEQCYLDRPENVVVEEGLLKITGRYESLDDPLCTRQWDEEEEPVSARFTSASLHTRDKFSFTYGRVEARLRVPSATGSWPAFWMRPQENVYGGWPTSGEIDVMEYVSQTPNEFYGTVHYDFFGHEEDGASIDLGGPVSNDFHEVAIDWTPTSIDWFVDGAHYHSFDSSRDIQGRRPFDEAFFLTLNFAIGGTWPENPDPTEFPATYAVDWVRVYQSPGG